MPPGLSSDRFLVTADGPVLERGTIPGGQLSNLRQQAIALGLADRFEDIERLYARCDDLLGGLIKVTPTSKVVGDLALYLASTGIDPDELAAEPGAHDLPESVIGFLQGELGTPPGGWPEPFRSAALRDRPREAPEPTLTAEQEAALAEPGPDRRAALSTMLFPGPAADLAQARERYGDLSVVPTRAFLYGLDHGAELAVDLEPGVRLFVELEAVTDPDEHGIRTVLCSLNGQARPVDARDRAITADVAAAEKADPGEAGHVAAPLTGVVTITVAEGDDVAAGDRVATIEAMKMESAVTAPEPGKVARVAVPSGTNVEPGDLLLVLER
jgi:pyruvate carboxylase